MPGRKIVSMPGDGIGKVVLPEAIRVLDAAGFEAEYIPADIGWEFWVKEGNPLPQRTLDVLAEILAQEYGFQAEFRHWAITGLCRDCFTKEG